MRLSESLPEQSSFFIRSSPEAPERGPFTLENLKDLAEFQHLTLQTWLRSAAETEFRPIRDASPELLAQLFPEKKKMAFKSLQKRENPDDNLPPVDSYAINRYDAPPPAVAPDVPPTSKTPSSPLTLKTQRDLPPPRPPASSPPLSPEPDPIRKKKKSDIHELLEE